MTKAVIKQVKQLNCSRAWLIYLLTIDMAETNTHRMELTPRIGIQVAARELS
jgi:hypothetical protein